MDLRITRYVFLYYGWWLLVILLLLMFLIPTLIPHCINFYFLFLFLLSIFSGDFSQNGYRVLHALPLSEKKTNLICWLTYVGFPTLFVALFCFIPSLEQRINIYYYIICIYIIIQNLNFLSRVYLQNDERVFLLLILQCIILLALYYYKVEIAEKLLLYAVIALTFLSFFLCKSVGLHRFENKISRPKKTLIGEIYFLVLYPYRTITLRPEFIFLPFYWTGYILLIVFPIRSNPFLNLVALMLLFLPYFNFYLQNHRVYTSIPLKRNYEFCKLIITIIMFSFFSNTLLFYYIPDEFNFRIFMIILTGTIFIKLLNFAIVFNYPKSYQGILFGIMIPESFQFNRYNLTEIPIWVLYILIAMNLLSIGCLYYTYLYSSKPYTYRLPMQYRNIYR